MFTYYNNLLEVELNFLSLRSTIGFIFFILLQRSFPLPFVYSNDLVIFRLKKQNKQKTIQTEDLYRFIRIFKNFCHHLLSQQIRIFALHFRKSQYTLKPILGIPTPIMFSLFAFIMS